MTRADLIHLATRLAQGPVPTQHKKVYVYQGEIKSLFDALPPSITVRTRVTDACDSASLPTQTEQIPVYLRERLAAHIQKLQHGRSTSSIVMQEATLFVRYQVPLSFLYDLTGDVHAIILHIDEEFSPKEWTFPSSVHYNSEATGDALEQLMGDQFIHGKEGEKTRP